MKFMIFPETTIEEAKLKFIQSVKQLYDEETCAINEVKFMEQFVIGDLNKKNRRIL